MTRESGLTTIEVVISLCLLGGLTYMMIFMMENQKEIVISANQEIEVTKTVNEVRKSLVDNRACAETFKSLSSDTPMGTIKEIQKVKSVSGSRVKFESAFRVNDRVGVSSPSNNLTIKGYSLDTGEEDSYERGVAFITIHFDKGLKRLKVKNPKRQIKIYIEENKEGIITNCSLNYLNKEVIKWSATRNGIKTPFSKVSIGESGPNMALVVRGGIFFNISERVIECGPRKAGLLFWNEEVGGLQFCNKKGAVNLFRNGPFFEGESFER